MLQFSFLSNFKKLLILRFEFSTIYRFSSVFHKTILNIVCKQKSIVSIARLEEIDQNEKASWFALENCALSLPLIGNWRTANEAFLQFLFRAKRQRQ